MDEVDDVDVPRSSQYNDFKHGSIIRIELENFMIYRHIELRPGPFLNLILGPNGSGKSAFVCSIIMGFGGDPHVTGRSSNLIDYVRFGSQMATITIEICSGNVNEKNHLIQREIRVTHKGNKNECHNHWKLNGESVNKAAIVEFTKKLNIDINNLCQILPQERVVEFSRMTPKELLFSTEKSIGDVDMYATHMKLISLSEEINDLEKKIKESRALVMKCQNFKTNIEPDLKLIKQKKKFEEEIEWLLKKQVWLEFEEKRLSYIAIKDEYIQKKSEYTEFEKKIKPLKDNVGITKSMLAKISEEKSKIKLQIRKSYLKLTDTHKAIDSYHENMNQLISAFHETISEHNRSKNRLATYEQDYNNYKNDLSNHPDKDVFRNQVQQVRMEQTQIEQEHRKIVLEIQNLKTQMDGYLDEQRYLVGRKKAINNLFNARMDKVNQMDSNTRQAYEWLKKNEDKFEGQIFPPLITQINVNSNEYSKYVEAAIGSVDMGTFLFENMNDLELFSKEVQENLKLLVNVAMIPKEGDNLLNEPTFDLKKYEKYGLFSRVSDLFTAPEPVMAYLIKTYHVDQIPVGNSKTEENIQELINYSPFKKILTNQSIYTIVISIYDNEKSTRITAMRPANYLNIIIDQEEIKRIDGDLKTLDESIGKNQTLIDQKNETLVDCKSRLAEKHNECQSIESKINEISKIEAKIQEKERQIKMIKESMLSVEHSKEDLARKLSEIQLKQLGLLEKIPSLLNECNEKNKSASTMELKLKYIYFMLASLENEYARVEQEEKDKRLELKTMGIKVTKLKDEAVEYRERAKQKSGLDFNEGTDPKIKAKIDALPKTLNELVDTISTLKMRSEGIRKVDNSLLEQYKNYQKEIESKTNQCEQLEKELGAKKAEVDSLKPIWIESLENLIEKINFNFSAFMKHLEFSGEVYLFKGHKEYTFDDYGIRIKVKFRDSEPMKDLDAYHQSGGERSVSTMIYMLSLQELAHVPFRVVDEINQGMDETNERRVFDLITKVSQKNSSQYFLLSPKLLTDLNYTDEMRIHVIFNGPHVYVDWNKALNNVLEK